jgi:hypothetical protein
LEFKKLYNLSKERIDLMNSTAPNFFSLIQGVFFENIILHIACLTDDEAMGKNNNLTIYCLLKIFKDDPIIEELQKQLENSKIAVTKAREWRNKYIGHRDYKLAIDPLENPLPTINYDEIGNAIAELNRLLNIVELHLNDSTTMFEGHISFTSADNMIRLLNYGNLQWKKRLKRFTEGRIEPGDNEPMPQI